MARGMLWLGFMTLVIPAWGDDALEAARTWRKANEANILKEFATLLRMPNVADNLEHQQVNATWIRDRLKERGVAAELLTLPNVPPVVYGELKAPGATRTILVYVHYDGQPADPSNWTHNPWEPTLYTASMEAGGKPRAWPKPGEPVDPEWRIYARAAGDDKVPIPAIFAALDALRTNNIQLTSNIKFFFEGEEEAGSPNLDRYLKTYRDKLQGDLWLFCDGPVHQSRKPQIAFGVRGVTTMEVTVYGAANGLHSGHYGNWAPVPGTMLAHLLASMKDEDGKVLVKGFYDTVTPIGEAEKRAIAALPEVETNLRKELGLAWTEGGNAPLAQRLLMPALTVSGLTSGNTGPLGRNVIPATATARLGVRLVRGNDPEHMLDLIEKHIRDQGYHIVYDEPDMETRTTHRKLIRVWRRESGYRAMRTEMDLPEAQDIIRAVRRAAGEDPVLMPTLGGSLPLYLFNDILDTPAIILPIANHDNNQHAPDENIRLANLWYGIDLYACVFTME